MTAPPKVVPPPAEDAAAAPDTSARLSIPIARQPDDTTCGPTSLHAVYRYFGDDISLTELIDQVQPLPGGGTLAVTLANHALRRGYAAKISTYNLHLFDPTWFQGEADVRRLLEEQRKHHRGERFRLATEAYLEYLSLGGKLEFGQRPSVLIRKYLKRNIPILTGLSATHLYRCAREFNDRYDSVRGKPEGHFVILSGYDPVKRRVMVADPLYDNPGFGSHYYAVDIETLVCSIMLGVITYDANLMVVHPKASEDSDANSDNS